MNESELLSSIANNESPVYLLEGKEQYPIENALAKLKSTLNPGYEELNYTVIDEDSEIDLIKIIEYSEAVPFMDQKRVIVVKNSDIFKAGAKAVPKNQVQALKEYLESPMKTTVLVFAPESVDKRGEVYKLINKKYDSFQSNRLTKIQMKNWVQDRFKKEKIKISPADIEYFIDKTGYLFRDSTVTLFDIDNEIKKIVALKEEVNKETIDKVLTPQKEDDIFKFLDAVFTFNEKDAYNILNAISQKQSGRSLLNVLIMLGRQITMMTKLKILKKCRKSDSEIGKILSVQSFVVRKTASQSKNFSYDELIELMNLCSDMDYRIKKGQIKDKIGLEVMISKICILNKNKLR